MVYRVYVEKKPGQTHEASSLLKEIKDFLQIENLSALRVLNRYDAENITEELFSGCVNTVFSEPQVDNVSYEVPTGDTVFAVEPLPGQYDQRADSAAQCIQIISLKKEISGCTFTNTLFRAELKVPSHWVLRLLNAVCFPGPHQLIALHLFRSIHSASLLVFSTFFVLYHTFSSFTTT